MVVVVAGKEEERTAVFLTFLLLLPWLNMFVAAGPVFGVV